MDEQSSTNTSIDTLVIGAGQAGIAMSEHLGRQNIQHLVLERDRVAEAWRTRRWDSLVANGPAWHDRFPNKEFPRTSADGFAPKDEVADYLEAYAREHDAPIKTGVEVQEVVPGDGESGFHIKTSQGEFKAQRVVVATGPFQRPMIPPFAPELQGIEQIHSADYRSPEQLGEGGVLVIGAGSSGVQIADEIRRSGKTVYLSVGAHDRPPRRYRGRDFCWWLGVLDEWNAITPERGREHVTIAVSGARGGENIDFRRLAQQGMRLVGMTDRFDGSAVHFRDDLATNIQNGDQRLLEMLRAADAYIERNGLELPEEPELHQMLPDPKDISHPIRQLDLHEAGISTIIWATGYARDYSWLKVDTFDEGGNPLHERGVAKEHGIYFLGLPWLSRRGSSFIWGVWHDASYVADQIAIQRHYEHYQPVSGKES